MSALLAGWMAGSKKTVDHRAFSRRFKELILGQDQVDVAGRLGYTQGRISQIARGERPSREFLERLIAEFELPREEWLGLAGFGPQAEEPEGEEQYERIADAVVERLMRAGVTVEHEHTTRKENVQEYFEAEVTRLVDANPEAKIDLETFRLALHHGRRALSREEVDSVVSDLARQIEEQSI